jgi:hypothetical protein
LRIVIGAGELKERRLTAGPLLTPAGSDEVLVWRIPSEKLTITLHRELIARLRDELLLSLAEKNPNGVRGILVGRHIDGGERQIIVDDYELTREQRGDEMFPAENNPILTVARRWPTRGDRPGALGLFRASGGNLLRPAAEDADIARSISRFGHNIALLIGFRRGKFKGALFLWHGESGAHQAFQLELPLDNAAAIGRWKGVAGTPWRAAVMSRGAVWGGAGLVLLAGALTFWSVREVKSGRQAAVQASYRPYRNLLDLRAQWEGQILDVAWNGEASPTRSAEDAQLEISDGGIARTIAISKVQFRGGRLYFAPLTPEVSVRLNVRDSDGREVSEYITVPNKLGLLFPHHVDMDSPTNGANTDPPADQYAGESGRGSARTSPNPIRPALRGFQQ